MAEHEVRGQHHKKQTFSFPFVKSNVWTVPEVRGWVAAQAVCGLPHAEVCKYPHL